MNKILWVSIIVISLAISSGFSDENKDMTLEGWGKWGPRENLDKFFADAEAIGFDALVTWSTDPGLLIKANEEISAVFKKHFK